MSRGAASPDKDTYGLPRAEESVGDHLGAGRRDQEAHGLILGSLLAESRLVHILEHLVETELAEALSAVANQGGEPALKLRERRVRPQLHKFATSLATSLSLLESAQEHLRSRRMGESVRDACVLRAKRAREGKSNRR